jgi:hypothetical protein
VELMPADRLTPIAGRILAEQPYPPRRVSLADIWSINWPLLAVILVPGPVLDVILALIPGVPHWVPLLLVALQLLSLGIWIVLVIAPHVIALRQGMPDAATVVDIVLQPRGGYRGHVTLDRGPGTAPATFYYLTSNKVKVGDRFNVLVSPSNGAVMATLGPISQQ